MPIQNEIIEKSKNLFSLNPVFKEPEVKGKKANRSEEILNSTVEVNGLVFDSDEQAMDRMDRIVDLANWKFNQAVASGVSSADAYNAVYIQTTLPWKTSDNQMVTVSVETICQVQDAAVNQLGAIWVQYG